VEVLANSDKPDDPPDVLQNEKLKKENTDTAQPTDGDDAIHEDKDGKDNAPLAEKVADAHVEPEEDSETAEAEADGPYLATERIDETDEEETAAGEEHSDAPDDEKAPDEPVEGSTEEGIAEDATETPEHAPDGAPDENDRISAAEVLAAGAAAGVSAGAMSAADADKEPSGQAETTAKASPREDPRPAAASTATETRRGGVFPMILGGAVVAVLGFFAGRSEVLDPYLPESLKGAVVDLAPLQEEIAAQQTALADQQSALTETTERLESQIAALAAEVEEATQNAAEPPQPPEGLSALAENLGALAERVEALEARPVPDAPDTENLATTDDVAGLQQALQAQEAELSALAERARRAEENATAEAQKVLARAALMRMSTAVEDGAAFGSELSALEEVAPVEVPEALRTAASEGVASLAELQADFPPAARAALAAARAEVPESEVVGLGGFLRRQLSVRSVVPREGDDPDAVLSRAEAAVRAGALGDALAELEALPEAARATMQEWIDRAATRQAVQEAAASLANSLTPN
jgi:hypothetical protein